MKICEKSHNDILSAIRASICSYKGAEENSAITDIHFMPKQDSGELIIFDDDDHELSHLVVSDWVDNDSDTFYADVEIDLRSILEELKEQGTFNDLSLMKPYSFVLVDEDKETVAELLLIDDEDTLLLNEELLKGLDDELNAFLKDLLEK